MIEIDSFSRLLQFERIELHLTVAERAFVLSWWKAGGLLGWDDDRPDPAFTHNNTAQSKPLPSIYNTAQARHSAKLFRMSDAANATQQAVEINAANAEDRLNDIKEAFEDVSEEAKGGGLLHDH